MEMLQLSTTQRKGAAAYLFMEGQLLRHDFLVNYAPPLIDEKPNLSDIGGSTGVYISRATYAVCNRNHLNLVAKFPISYSSFQDKLQGVVYQYGTLGDNVARILTSCIDSTILAHTGSTLGAHVASLRRVGEVCYNRGLLDHLRNRRKTGSLIESHRLFRDITAPVLFKTADEFEAFFAGVDTLRVFNHSVFDHFADIAADIADDVDDFTYQINENKDILDDVLAIVDRNCVAVDNLLFAMQRYRQEQAALIYHTDADAVFELIEQSKNFNLNAKIRGEH